MLFSAFRIGKSSGVINASGDGLFKYAETISKWDLVGFIVYLLVLAHLKTLIGLDLCFFPTGQKIGDWELNMCHP